MSSSDRFVWIVTNDAFNSTHKRRQHVVSALPTTSSQTVCPPIHRSIITGCGLEFTTEYTLNAHQMAVRKGTTSTIGYGYDTLRIDDTAGATRAANRTGHVCDKCYIIFVTKPGLRSHRRRTVHSATAATKQYVCAHNSCGKSFGTSRGLKRHRLRVHQAVSGQYRCDCCAKRFYHNYSLKQHRLTVHSEAATRVLQAPIATEVNGPSVAMETTVSNYIPIAPATVLPVTQFSRPSQRYCPTTATTEPNNSTLDSEVEVIDELPAYKRLVRTRPITGHTSMPTIIDISDTSSDENSGHESADSEPEVMVISHYSDSLYTCGVDGCGQRFIWQIGLDGHLRNAHKVAVDRRHPCGHCEHSFDTVDQWADHKLECIRTLRSLREYMCHKCGEPYVTNEELAQHLRSRHPSTPFIPCGACNLWFLTDTHRDRHRESVHPRPQFACDQEFYIRRQLIGHQYTVHSQPMPNPFTCDECGQHFAREVTLLRHQMSVHSISPPVSVTCEKCDKWFVNTNDLRQHKRRKNH
ncbi:unnamed protein product [Medioppia subpectinata]|uniref:C2H2-type domain-containing protein n=1 Tax=Medioppia subpectinata TaxID=1979941 RepID=A0A7R9KPV2_9ACAR|nr:unnamed protein product [Medioppia subpectinata]CAG2107292.1 unnamed protein product [Medioppia subpectinata]